MEGKIEISDDAVAKIAKDIDDEVINGTFFTEDKTVEVLPKGDLISDTALQMSKLDKDGARELFKELLEDIDFNYFKIGGVLYTMKEKGWYVGDYSEYVENVMGIRAAKGYYLTSIYENLVKSGLQWEEVKHIGWSKMRVIAKFLAKGTKEEQFEWLNKANHMTHVQLQANVKALKAGEGYTKAEETSSKIKTITLKLYEDQLPTAEAAIKKAKEELGTDSDIQAIDIIMQSYISDSFDLIITDDFIEEQLKKLGKDKVIELVDKLFPS
jgi:hypothetical protein